MSALDRHRTVNQGAAHDALVAHLMLVHAVRVHGPNCAVTWEAWRASAAADARHDAIACALAAVHRRASR